MLYRLRAVGFVALAVMLAGPIAGLVSTPALAQAVGQILVEGNQRVEPETVRSYMQIQPRGRDRGQKVDKSIKSLFQTGLFSRRADHAAAARTWSSRSRKIRSSTGSTSRAIPDSTTPPWAKEAELKERTIFTRSRVQGRCPAPGGGFIAARATLPPGIEPKIIRLPQNRVEPGVRDPGGRLDQGRTASTSSATRLSARAISLRSVITTGAKAAWWKFFSTSDTLRSRPAELRQGAAAPLLPEERLCRLPLVISATAELAPDGGQLLHHLQHRGRSRIHRRQRRGECRLHRARRRRAGLGRDLRRRQSTKKARWTSRSRR